MTEFSDEFIKYILTGEKPYRSPKQKIYAFIRGIIWRISNAYDCLVKGIDPYA